MTRYRWSVVVVLAVTLAFAAPAQAAVVGEIKGKVTDEAGRPLAGVTVIVTSAALQGEQAEITDRDGYFVITNLPPGTYVARFFYLDVGTPRVERRNVILSVGQTVLVNARIRTRAARVETYTINERAPAIDVGTAAVGLTLTPDVLLNLPTGRTYGSVLGFTPGSQDDGMGVGFSGATSLENSYLLDGINTTGLTNGALVSALPVEFARQIQVLTGGYNAEWGRAMGGFVNVVTKQGSNEVHGGLWSFVSPWSAPARRVERTNESIVIEGLPGLGLDFGAELSGPIVRDRAWFYVGFMPQLSFDYSRRAYRALVDADGDGQPDLDPSKSPCPAYLADRSLCARKPAPERMEDIATSRRYRALGTSYATVAKLTLRPAPDHDLTASFFGTPGTWAGRGAIVGSIAQAGADDSGATYDASLRWVGKFRQRRLQVEVVAGWHREASDSWPTDTSRPTVAHQVPRSILEYNTPEDAFPEACRDASEAFVKCPAQGFTTGGDSDFSHLRADRVSLLVRATYYVRALGHHALKAGVDPQVKFMESSWGDAFGYAAVERTPDRAGRGRIMVNGGAMPAGGDRGNTCPADAQLLPYWDTDPEGNEVRRNLCTKKGWGARSRTMEYAAFLQDRWNLLPNLTLDLGLRWEGFQIAGDKGFQEIGVWNNWAPRVGLVYDWTGQGKSKVYASFGRFYESVPLSLNDIAFNVKGFMTEAWRYPTMDAMYAACGFGVNMDIAKCRPTGLSAPGSVYGDPSGARRTYFGGEPMKVVPHLQGQHSDQISAGIQYEIATDLVAGAAYERRWLGDVIEDILPDPESGWYYLANPGRAPDTSGIERQIAQLEGKTDPTSTAARDALKQKLSAYRIIAKYPRARRDYDALVLTLAKRFSRSWYLNASYGYARTRGNYQGLYQSFNGQADSNTLSVFDFRDTLANTSGPLPQDIPHTVRLLGYRTFRLGAKDTLVLGVTARAQSGVPINARGVNWAGVEIYLLPRGSAGRTPWTYNVDLALRYQHKMADGVAMTLSLDVFNVFDLQQVTLAAEVYAVEPTAPIVNGRIADLRHLKNLDGTPATGWYQFGDAKAYQSPLALRFGARLTF